MADPGRFQQIVLNLLSNAVKFTPQDGTITLRTSNENGTIRIDLIDTGVGVEPNVLPRLFGPFEQGERTVTRKFGGLGLGLSIVKALVEMHKASITAISEGADKGATFTLRVETVVPATSVPTQQIESPAAEAGTTDSRFRVLLVEDHQDTRLMLSKLLGSFRCEVTAAGSGCVANTALADEEGVTCEMHAAADRAVWRAALVALESYRLAYYRLWRGTELGGVLERLDPPVSNGRLRRTRRKQERPSGMGPEETSKPADRSTGR